MFPANAKLNELLALLDFFAPVSQGAASGNTPNWIYTGNVADQFQVLVLTGVMASTATLAVQVNQATSSGGAGSKAITGKSLSLSQAGGNSGQINTIDFKGQDLDTNNGFCYVQVGFTEASAASLLSILLLGTGRFEAVNAPGASINSAAVGTQV